jgi:hypothetical protein
VTRAEVARWHLPLLVGVLPLLVVGFYASGVANRLSFAVWGAIAASAWFATLRIGLVRGWNRAHRAGALLFVASAALAALAPLRALDGAALDSGLRAVAPALAPVVPGPVATVVAAALCALAGGGVLVASGGAANRREASP